MKHGICWENQKGKCAKLTRRGTPGGWYQCLLLFAGASLCLLSAWMQLREVYPGLRLLELPGAYGVYVLLLAAVLATVYGSGILRRWWLRLLPALPVGWGFYRYYMAHRLPIEDGGLYVARCYITELCRFFRTSMLFPSGLVGEAPRALLFWSLLLLCALFILAAVFRAYWLLLLLPGGLLAAGIAVGKSPQWDSLFVLLAAGVVLVGRWAMLPDRWYVRTAQLAGALCICIITGFLFSAVPQRVVGMHEDIQRRQWALEDAALALPVWGLYEQHGAVDNHFPRSTGREVLSFWLSDEPTENIYLKDYAASCYADGQWTKDPSIFAAAADEHGLEPSAAGEQMLSKTYEAGENIFNNVEEIDYPGSGGWSMAKPGQHGYQVTCRSFGTSAPLPYMSKLPGQLTMEGDAEAKRPWNVRGYSGSLMMGGRESDPLAEYLLMYYTAKSWLWHAQSYLIAADSQMHLADVTHDWYGAMAKDSYAPESENPLLEDFMYRYIFVPDMFDEMRLSLYSLWIGGQTATLNYMRLSNAWTVSQCLQSFGTYSKNLDPLPEGADPVDYFLGTSEKGYCVHYASAATLILQSMGIPARYASGYVVFPDDFEEAADADGYTAVVTDARAHAWVEIYLEDFGWVPFEVTPGFARVGEAESEASQIAQDDGGESGDGAPKDDASKEHQDNPREEEDVTPDEQPQEGHGTDPKEDAAGMSREMRRALYSLAGILAAAIGIYVMVRVMQERGRRREEQIKRALREGRYNDAANRMNLHIYRLLKRRTAGAGVRDDEGYRDALKKLDGGGDADAYIRLVKQAHFSDSEMCEADARTLYGMYLKYRETLKYGKPKTGR